MSSFSLFWCDTRNYSLHIYLIVTLTVMMWPNTTPCAPVYHMHSIFVVWLHVLDIHHTHTHTHTTSHTAVCVVWVYMWINDDDDYGSSFNMYIASFSCCKKWSFTQPACWSSGMPWLQYIPHALSINLSNNLTPFGVKSYWCCICKPT